jgi:hypothetical protein
MSLSEYSQRDAWDAIECWGENHANRMPSDSGESSYVPSIFQFAWPQWPVSVVVRNSEKLPVVLTAVMTVRHVSLVRARQVTFPRSVPFPVSPTTIIPSALLSSVLLAAHSVLDRSSRHWIKIGSRASGRETDSRGWTRVIECTYTLIDFSPSTWQQPPEIHPEDLWLPCKLYYHSIDASLTRFQEFSSEKRYQRRQMA